MKDLLEILHDENRITETVAEKAKTQYFSLCEAAKTDFNESFRDFEKTTDEVGLDTFFGGILCNNVTYEALFDVIKLCLILSHGNASVESGFSINKSLLIENLHEETIVSQRIVYDAVSELGGIKSVVICKKMMQSVCAARKNYLLHLETKRESLTQEEKVKGEKRKINHEIKRLDEEMKRSTDRRTSFGTEDKRITK